MSEQKYLLMYQLQKNLAYWKTKDDTDTLEETFKTARPIKYKWDDTDDDSTTEQDSSSVSYHY